jgi:hypothetical protein
MPSLARRGCGHPVTISCSAATNLYHHFAAQVLLCSNTLINFCLFFLLCRRLVVGLRPHRRLYLLSHILVSLFACLKSRLLAHYSCYLTS